MGLFSDDLKPWSTKQNNCCQRLCHPFMLIWYLTYKSQAEEVFHSPVGKITWATNYLLLELTLEDLRHKSDLFVGEGHSAQVPERRLG